jgi:hypothetical protein
MTKQEHAAPQSTSASLALCTDVTVQPECRGSLQLSESSRFNHQGLSASLSEWALQVQVLAHKRSRALAARPMKLAIHHDHSRFRYRAICSPSHQWAPCLDGCALCTLSTRTRKLKSSTVQCKKSQRATMFRDVPHVDRSCGTLWRTHLH